MKLKLIIIGAVIIATSGWGVALYQTSQALNRTVCDSNTGKCYNPDPAPVATPTPSVTPTPEPSPLAQVTTQTTTPPKTNECSE